MCRSKKSEKKKKKKQQTAIEVCGSSGERDCWVQ